MAKTVGVRLSDEQYAELVARADHERRKLSDYIRMCIFAEPTAVKSRPLSEVKKALDTEWRSFSKEEQLGKRKR